MAPWCRSRAAQALFRVTAVTCRSSAAASLLQRAQPLHPTGRDSQDPADPRPDAEPGADAGADPGAHREPDAFPDRGSQLDRFKFRVTYVTDPQILRGSFSAISRLMFTTK